MKNLLYIVLLLLFYSCQKQEPASNDIQKLSHQHPIPFSPEGYVCYRSLETLVIDGKDDEEAWKNAPWTNSFVDIEGELKPKPTHDTKVKMLWDDAYFYFYAKLEEPHVWATLRQRDTVIFYDDDFEIFIDPDGDSHNYYELEVNAYNTLWELILLRPYRVDNKHKVLDNWNIPNIKTAVHIEGTLNDPQDEDEYWSVEVAIPWSALEEFAPGGKMPNQGDQWRVNFSRVDWTMKVENGTYVKAKDTATNKTLPEDNWVWSPTGFIAMHMPEQWGYVQFSTLNGEQTESFVDHPDEKIKWALWNMYFQQLQYFEKEKKYTDNLSFFNIPVLEKSSCDFKPVIHTTPNLFEIIAASCEGEGSWSIRQDGMIEFFD
ncbi:MAG: carbohydrate-binding family 9-like protein [Chitinophagales bacterium]|nr:carbohydrate-binding family 9-like protein [Chitinophagales bacterium]